MLEIRHQGEKIIFDNGDVSSSSKSGILIDFYETFKENLNDIPSWERDAYLASNARDIGFEKIIYQEPEFDPDVIY